MRILVVEDDASLAVAICSELKRRGYIVDYMDHLAAAGDAIRSTGYALVLVERRLSDGEGLALVALAKRLDVPPQFIVITALSAMSDVVLGLDAGADDYIIKPFDMDELMARVRAVLRRTAKTSSAQIQCGHLTYQPGDRFLEVGGQEIALPRREMALLEALITRARRVVPRDLLMNEMFGFEDDIQSNTLESHVSRLRARLSELSAGVIIRSVRGIGYMLDIAESSQNTAMSAEDGT
jgi:DNA-binding response OmpR family regulator